jgi:hypothetical protein
MGHVQIDGLRSRVNLRTMGAPDDAQTGEFNLLVELRGVAIPKVLAERTEGLERLAFVADSACERGSRAIGGGAG